MAKSWSRFSLGGRRSCAAKNIKARGALAVRAGHEICVIVTQLDRGKNLCRGCFGMAGKGFQAIRPQTRHRVKKEKDISTRGTRPDIASAAKNQ